MYICENVHLQLKRIHVGLWRVELQCRVIEEKVGDRTVERNVAIMVQGKAIIRTFCLPALT